jgi:hypothetical protein
LSDYVLVECHLAKDASRPGARFGRVRFLVHLGRVCGLPDYVLAVGFGPLRFGRVRFDPVEHRKVLDGACHPESSGTTTIVHDTSYNIPTRSQRPNAVSRPMLANLMAFPVPTGRSRISNRDN